MYIDIDVNFCMVLIIDWLLKGCFCDWVIIVVFGDNLYCVVYILVEEVGFDVV